MSESKQATAESLPIIAALPALNDALRNRRVVLEAPPGAGKSTYLPLWLLDRDADITHRIVLIQPRRLAAANVARYLAQQTGRPLGDMVGLRTRFDHFVSANTVIEVVTEGVFLRQIQRDPELTGIAYVLFDEYHERSWQADLALAFALESQSQWRAEDAPLSLIVMSATLPAAAIAQWLDAPIVRAQGRSFPVQISYSPVGRADSIDHLVAQIEAALREGARKILVFLAGWQPMQRVQRRLLERAQCEVHLLHSSVPPEQQQAAMSFDANALPSVVLATNIAETSLTIAGVDTVIDTGQVRRPRFDPSRGMDQLETGWISRASAEQRAGRAGRLGPGSCIRLWSQEQQGRLLAHDPAEIHQVDLAPLVLELALWGGDVALLPEAPPEQRMRDARQLLQNLGALDSAGHITAAGRAMSQLGLHPRLGRLVQCGRERNQLHAACQLAALLSEGDFLRRDGNELSADLDWRLQLLQNKRGDAAIQQGVAQRIRQLTTQLLQRSGGKREENIIDGCGALLLAAFPDRLARPRHSGSGRYLTADGFEVVVSEHDSLRRAPWLVIAEHDGNRQGARVRLAAAIDESDVQKFLERHSETQDVVEWDEAAQRLTAKRLRRIGAIVLDEQSFTIDDETANRFWFKLLCERGSAWLQWPDTVNAWLGRVRWLQQKIDNWPDFSERALLDSLEEWLAPYLLGVRRVADLRALDYAAILRERLDYAQQQKLAQLAPERLQLPSGSSHSIEYRPDAAPKLAARLPEFYGLNQHPCVAGEPLLLELLSPAHRPVQLTQDLPGFWRSSYPEVRKEMKGRYPRHFWPEEPWSAPATATTKRRMPAPPE